MPCLICELQKCKENEDAAVYVCQDCIRKRKELNGGSLKDISNEFLEEVSEYYKKRKKKQKVTNPF